MKPEQRVGEWRTSVHRDHKLRQENKCDRNQIRTAIHQLDEICLDLMSLNLYLLRGDYTGMQEDVLRIKSDVRSLAEYWRRDWNGPPPTMPVPTARSAIPAAPPVPDWDTAHRRFTALAVEYAGYECDPLAVLRLPAMSDVTVPATARFVDAFAEAQALDTDQRPAPEFAALYVAAVDRACRSWQAARGAAERIRLSGFSPQERARVERVIKLLTTAADTSHEAERLAAYALARRELVQLDLAGKITLPRAARAALDVNAQGVLQGAPIPPSAPPPGPQCAPAPLFSPVQIPPQRSAPSCDSAPGAAPGPPGLRRRFADLLNQRFEDTIKSYCPYIWESDQ